MIETKELAVGESIEVKGSAKKPYTVKNVDGVVWSCDCPSWRNKGGGVLRSCKHIVSIRGKEAEETRLGRVVEQAKVKITKPTAPPVLLAETWSPDIDPTGWMVSEKLDGVRAWWDGENFISRLGNIYHAPDWYKKFMPKGVVLDGELWLGRKRFNECVSIVRRQFPTEDWGGVFYVIYDAPKAKGTFVERIKYCVNLIANTTHLYTSVLKQEVCTGLDDLKARLKKIEGFGGEGVMLRKADSLYEEGRSNTLLKVKSFYDDEATVIGHEPGKGKNKGRVGALRVKMANDVEFSLGSGLSNSQRDNPIPIGTKVTFKYQEISPKTGAPRFPIFLRVCVG